MIFEDTNVGLLTFFIFSLMLWLISVICIKKNTYSMKRKTTALLFILTMLLALDLVMLNVISTEAGYGIAMALAIAYGLDYYYFDPKVYNTIILRSAQDISEYTQGEKVQKDGEKDTPNE